MCGRLCQSGGSTALAMGPGSDLGACSRVGWPWITVVGACSGTQRSQSVGCLLVGPGLGYIEGSLARLGRTFADLPGLLVLDADALNQLSGAVEGWRWFLKRMGPTWITPHPQEFARLFPCCDQGTPLERAVAAAERSGVVVLLKGAHSVIADPSGSVYQLVGTDRQVARTGLGDLLAGLAEGVGSATAGGRWPGGWGRSGCGGVAACPGRWSLQPRQRGTGDR